MIFESEISRCVTTRSAEERHAVSTESLYYLDIRFNLLLNLIMTIGQVILSIVL